MMKFFSETNLNGLKNAMQMKLAKKGEYLFWEGELADRLFYVFQGGVRITKTSEAGKSLILHLYQTGDLFGQIDPFQNSVQNFSAEVTADCKVGVIMRKDLEELLQQHSDLAIEFMKWMGLMHRMTEAKFRDLMMYGKPGALCSLLIRLGNSYGVPSGEHTLIDYKLSNAEMADMIGSTREGVNRMLSEMRKEDAITYRNGQIVIKNANYLRNICHCENCPLEICRM
ncbi:Crp/Fnr family transcriptional regulator [Paenibacillus anseongense]|uniref:Crp/Fnr family transcriptional regulator n=1 Tax=Paenibacillus TaxID=44249 RepID=UPI003AF19596